MTFKKGDLVVWTENIDPFPVPGLRSNDLGVVVTVENRSWFNIRVHWFRTKQIGICSNESLNKVSK